MKPTWGHKAERHGGAGAWLISKAGASPHEVLGAPLPCTSGKPALSQSQAPSCSELQSWGSMLQCQLRKLALQLCLSLPRLGSVALCLRRARAELPLAAWLELEAALPLWAQPCLLQASCGKWLLPGRSASPLPPGLLSSTQGPAGKPGSRGSWPSWQGAAPAPSPPPPKPQLLFLGSSLASSPAGRAMVRAGSWLLQLFLRGCAARAC